MEELLAITLIAILALCFVLYIKRRCNAKILQQKAEIDGLNSQCEGLKQDKINMLKNNNMLTQQKDDLQKSNLQLQKEIRELLAHPNGKLANQLRVSQLLQESTFQL